MRASFLGDAPALRLIGETRFTNKNQRREKKRKSKHLKELKEVAPPPRDLRSRRTVIKSSLRAHVG